MIYNKQYVEDNLEKKGITSFWQADRYLGFLAPDYVSEFCDGQHIFINVEQYTLYNKAMMFYDVETANAILECADPEEINRLGKTIRFVDPVIWNTKSQTILASGNFLKFNQDLELREKLLNTGSTIIAYANPYDTEWGCGTEDYGRLDSWHGTNIFGYSLMIARDNCRRNKIYESTYYDKY